MRRVFPQILTTTFAIIISSGFAFTNVNAQPAGRDADERSVDQQLRDELGGDLLEGLDDIPIDPDDLDKKDAPVAPDEQKLLDELPDGEDIGQGPEDPITRIARQMRDAQRRIEQQEMSQETQELQQRIVAQLDALIQQLQQKRQSSASGSKQPSPSAQDIKQPKQPGEGRPNQGQQQASNKPAAESTERLGQENAPDSESAALEALVKQVWGHLPDRARQEVQNATVEDFLPKYQQIIEDYYRRLAEETSR